MKTIEKQTTQTLAGIREAMAGTHPGYAVDARLEKEPTIQNSIEGDAPMELLLELERQLEDLTALTTMIRAQRNQVAAQRAAAPKHHGDMKTPLTISGLTRSGLQEVSRLAMLEAAEGGKNVPSWFRRMVGRGKVPMDQALDMIPGLLNGSLDRDDVDQIVQEAAERRAAGRRTDTA